MQERQHKWLLHFNSFLSQRPESLQKQLTPLLLKILRQLRHRNMDQELREHYSIRLVGIFSNFCDSKYEILDSILELFGLTFQQAKYEFSTVLCYYGFRDKVSFEQRALFEKYSFSSRNRRLFSDELICCFDITTAMSTTEVQLKLSHKQIVQLKLPQEICFLPKNVIVIKKNSVQYNELHFTKPAPCQCEECGLLDKAYNFKSYSKEQLITTLKEQKCRCVSNFVGYLLNNGMADELHANRRKITEDYFCHYQSVLIQNVGCIKIFSEFCFDKQCLFQCMSCKNPINYYKFGSPCRLELRKSQFGYGLFAAHEIPKGTIVCEYTGEIVGNNRTLTRGMMQDAWRQSYFFDLRSDSEYAVDAVQYGNEGRWINHSKEPNLQVNEVLSEDISKDPMVQLWFISRRNIMAGEEVLIDYGYQEEVLDIYTWCR